MSHSRMVFVIVLKYNIQSSNRSCMNIEYFEIRWKSKRRFFWIKSRDIITKLPLSILIAHYKLGTGTGGISHFLKTNKEKFPPGISMELSGTKCIEKRAAGVRKNYTWLVWNCGVVKEIHCEIFLKFSVFVEVDIR